MFQIDILYKRVPLPDHYTLIDIAYIYSWKRVSCIPLSIFQLKSNGVVSCALQNEPMKFFFKISDINKATDRFDFVEPTVLPEVVNKPVRVAKTSKKSEKRDKIRTSQVNSKKIKNEIVKSDKNRVIVDDCKDDESIEKEITEEIKSRIQNDPTNDKTSIYTNITLNRSNNIEIITKIQKVSNRNGQPIGLNIIKQTVKKSKPLPLPTITPSVASSAQNNSLQIKSEDKNGENVSVQIDVKQEKIGKDAESSAKSDNKVLTPVKTYKNENNKTEQDENKTDMKQNKSEKKKEASNSEIKVKEEPVTVNIKTEPVEDEIEKSIFLKSIELTARSSLLKPPASEKKTPSPEKKPPLTLSPEMKYKPFETKPSSSHKVNLSHKPVSSQKRKNSSPIKNPQPAKKPRASKKPKHIHNPMVKQMVTNVNQGASSLNRIVEQNSPKATTQKELQSLFDSCKINIPSSLSITLKESSEDDANRRTPTTIKPVQNFIEILKISENGNIQETTPSKLVKMEQQATLTPLQKSSPIPESQVKTEDNQPQNLKTSSPASSPKPILSPSSTKTPQSPLTTPIPLKTPPTPTSQNKPNSNLPSQLKHMAKENLVKLNPRSAQTFQKMFEEAIKKPEFSTKLVVLPKKDANEASASVVASKVQKNVLDLSVGENGGNKRNILEIASQLQKKTKLSNDLVMEKKVVDNAEYLKAPPGKVAIPRLNNQRPSSKASLHTPSKQIKTENKSPVTSVDLHSSRLGINYTVSVGGNNISPGQKEAKTVQASSISPQHSFSFKSEAQPFSKELPSTKTTKPVHFSPKESISTPLKEEIHSPKPSAFSPKLSLSSAKITSPTLPSPSSTSKAIIKMDPLRLQTPPSSTISSSKPSPKQSKSPCRVPTPKTGSMSPNQILEKYNIQNLAQLTASFNFNAANFVMNPANQLAALQQAMILKHFEMQNRQNWLNMNPSPLVQYEKYLQSLTQGQNHLLGNIKEN